MIIGFMLICIGGITDMVRDYSDVQESGLPSAVNLIYGILFIINFYIILS